MKRGTTAEDEEAVAALHPPAPGGDRGGAVQVRAAVGLHLPHPGRGGDLRRQPGTSCTLAADELRQGLAEIPGIVDLKSSAELGNPELQVTFNREQLVQLGLDLADVAATVRNKIQGDVATRFTQGDREIDILVRSVARGQASVDEVEDLIVGQRGSAARAPSASAPSRGSRSTARCSRPRPERADPPLRRWPRCGSPKGPSEIRRIGQKRAAVISGNLVGRDMGAVAADIERADAPRRCRCRSTAALGGQQEEMARSIRSLLMAMGLAIFLVYLVMASQFESFLHPFVIIFTLPLGAIGVVAALAADRQHGQRRRPDRRRDAGRHRGQQRHRPDRRGQPPAPRRGLGEARGPDRGRPAAPAADPDDLGDHHLRPAADGRSGLGEGAELRAPLAITVIGGLAVATLLTLVVIPVVYSLLDRQVLAADEAAPTESSDDRAPSLGVAGTAQPAEAAG